MGDLTKNFSRSEFACQCGCGRDDISREVVDRLQLLRNKVGRMDVISGLRCEKHNEDEGGVKNSDHIGGWCADVACPEVDYNSAVRAAFLVGFYQIGFGAGKLHLGMKSGERRWWCYKVETEHVG